MIPVCFHQRSYLLTACWRASTCWMGCLFSSSVLCLCIALSSILSPPSSPPFMMIPCSPCASTFDLPPLFISVTFVQLPQLLIVLFIFCVCLSVLCVLWRRSPGSVHPVSASGSPCGRLPASPEACHFQGLQHTLLPCCSPGSGATAQPGHACWHDTER